MLGICVWEIMLTVYNALFGIYMSVQALLLFHIRVYLTVTSNFRNMKELWISSLLLH